MRTSKVILVIQVTEVPPVKVLRHMHGLTLRMKHLIEHCFVVKARVSTMKVSPSQRSTE
jgi:hypothetical protein